MREVNWRKALNLCGVASGPVDAVRWKVR